MSVCMSSHVSRKSHPNFKSLNVVYKLTADIGHMVHGIGNIDVSAVLQQLFITFQHIHYGMPQEQQTAHWRQNNRPHVFTIAL